MLLPQYELDVIQVFGASHFWIGTRSQHQLNRLLNQLASSGVVGQNQTALTHFMQGAAKDVVARCSVAETDLSTWMVQQGWAEPKDTNEPVLVQAAAAAKKGKLGLWRGAE